MAYISAMNAPTPDLHPTTPPTWRLDDLYLGRDDPKISADLAAAEADNNALVALKGQFVAHRADPRTLGRLIDEGIRLYESAANQPVERRRLRLPRRLDRARTIRPGPSSRPISARAARPIGAESLFFTLELNELEDAEIEAALERLAGRGPLAALAAPRAARRGRTS